PLAICDARSISTRDFVVSERRYPNRVGQTYAITYNPEHRWYWLPRMRREEALVFKVYDSAKDGRARWSAHTAFEDPTSPPAPTSRHGDALETPPGGFLQTRRRGGARPRRLPPGRAPRRRAARGLRLAQCELQSRTFHPQNCRAPAIESTRRAMPSPPARESAGGSAASRLRKMCLQ